MIPAADQWGPFADGLSQAERVGRLRALLAIVHLLTGPRGRGVVAQLRAAETDEGLLPVALDAFNRLEPLDRRRALSTYATISRPS